METTTTSSTQQWGPQHYEPAGLEVAPPESNLEYHNPPFQEKFAYDDASPRQAHLSSWKTEDGADSPNLESGKDARNHGLLPKTRRQRLVWLAVALLLTAIIVGGAVGGTLGSKKASKTGGVTGSSPATSTSSAAPSSPTTSSGGTPTTTPPKAIKQNSPLAVTAFRRVDGVEIHLFFEGPDTVFYQSIYDSANGPVTANSSSLWKPPTAATTKAAPISPLCATTIVWSRHFQPQFQIYHFSPPNNLLTGTNFNAQSQPPIGEDGVKIYNLTSHPSSRIACYWPYIIYQDIDNKYVEMRDYLDGFGIGTFSPAAEYVARSLQVLGTQASRIGIVPLSTLFSTTARKGGYGIIGQSNAGDLIAFIPDEKQTTNVTRSWSKGTNFPNINLPQGASFTAFATARPNDSGNRTNTYVLYQNTDGKIGTVFRDDESDWKTSQPDALADADKGTDIACVTMPESMDSGTGNVLLLEGVSTETRCYFQRGGAVVEVRFDGADWEELGTVPLP